MVQLTRPTPDQRSTVARATMVAAVWRDLNDFGLRAATFGAFVAGTGFALLVAVSREPTYLLACVLSLAVAGVGSISMRSAKPDVDLTFTLGALAATITGGLSSPLIRGGMSVAVVVLALIGALVIPQRKQRRYLATMGALIGGQLLWPVFGLATLFEAVATLIVSGICFMIGVGWVLKARGALEQSEQTRLAIFRSVPVGLFRCSPSGEIIDANPALASMLGCGDPAALLGLQIGELHEDPEDWAALAETLELSDGPQRFAHRLIPATGDPLWVRGFAQAVTDDAGAVLYHEGSIEDVTQRRQVEETARRHADRFRAVFERAPIAIWEEDYSAVGERLDELRHHGITDLREYLARHPDEVRSLIRRIEFIDVNPAGVALLGASSKEEALKGMDADLLPEEVTEGFVDEFVAIWENRDSIMIEIKGSTVDGRTTDLALSWTVGRTPAGALDLSHVVVAIQDIAMIKQAERDLAALVESKDSLVASVSHELRTPITTILGMAFELRDNRALFSEDEVTDLVSIVADQSRELSNIVEDLLVAARSDSDTLTVRPEIVNLTTELGKIMPTEPAGTVIDIDGPILAWADPLRFRQILRNLVTNAAKYGGPNVRIAAEANTKTVRITVSDDGPGVPEDDRDRIFDPYFRSQHDTALPGSLGLGLPVSRRLARLMDGDLTYLCDEASTFELTLPAPMRGHFL